MTEEEFREVVMCHRQMMMAIAMTVLCDRDDALDCLQETFAKLWKNRNRIMEMENLKQYCISSVKNNALMILRKKRNCSLNYSEDIISDEDSSKKLEGKESVIILDRGLRSLPEMQRKVILMSAVSDMSAPEISELTDLAPANVRQLLSRGRRALKEYFKKNG